MEKKMYTEEEVEKLVNKAILEESIKGRKELSKYDDEVSILLGKWIKYGKTVLTILLLLLVPTTVLSIINLLTR